MKKVFSIILFMFFVLHTFADEPLLIPENYKIYSKNERYFLDCNTKENITICYEIPFIENNDEVEIDYICEPENLAIEKWKITECGLNAYISNNGEFCVLDFHGELVPTNVYKNYVLFKVYKNGKEHGKILLSDLVQKKRNLQKTVSHNYWGKIKLFEDNGILFETVEGEKRFDFSSNKIVKK